MEGLSNAAAHSPFAVLTLIAAPALLTNASSVLAMSTINRMLRTRDRMRELYLQSESDKVTGPESHRLVEVVNRVEAQAVLLLRALNSIYVALGAFVSATLVTLLGASLSGFEDALWFRLLAGLGLALGLVGVGGLVTGSLHLLHATRISLVNIREEAQFIRRHEAQRLVQS